MRVLPFGERRPTASSKRMPARPDGPGGFGFGSVKICVTVVPAGVIFARNAP